MSDHTATHSILLIGVGNEYRSDDAVGILAARRLKEHALSNLTIHEVSGDEAGLLDLWKGFEKVILIDAISADTPPGTIHRFDAHLRPLPSKYFRFSSHAFGVGDAIEMARTLQTLPKVLIVYGVEGHRYDAGTMISPEVAGAMNVVLELVTEEIKSINTCTRH